MFTVVIGGHLGRDPETRVTPSGQKVTTFSMAVNQRKGREDVTTWVRVTVWGDRFDKMLSFVKKGSGVIVTGKMMPPSSYTDKEGRTQFSLEVTAEMIEFSPFGKADRAGEGQTQQYGSQGGGGGGGYESQGASHQGGQYQTTGANQYSTPASSYNDQAVGQGEFSATDDEIPF
jgi:single-strand DNA-binding protein